MDPHRVNRNGEAEALSSAQTLGNLKGQDLWEKMYTSGIKLARPPRPSKSLYGLFHGPSLPRCCAQIARWVMVRPGVSGTWLTVALDAPCQRGGLRSCLAACCKESSTSCAQAHSSSHQCAGGGRPASGWHCPHDLFRTCHGGPKHHSLKLSGGVDETVLMRSRRVPWLGEYFLTISSASNTQSLHCWMWMSTHSQ